MNEEIKDVLSKNVPQQFDPESDLTVVPEDAVNKLIETLPKHSALKAVANKLIVKPDSVETQTKGGVFIPDMGQDAPTKGIVVAVGPGYLTATGIFVPLTVKVGDRVIYTKYGAAKFEHEDEEYATLEEKDLLTII